METILEYRTEVELLYKDQYIMLQIFQDYPTLEVNDIIYANYETIGITDNINLLNISKEFENKIHKIETKLYKIKKELKPKIFENNFNVLSLYTELNEITEG